MQACNLVADTCIEVPLKIQGVFFVFLLSNRHPKNVLVAKFESAESAKNVIISRGYLRGNSK